MTTNNCVYIVLGNDLLPDGTKPLPQPMLPYNISEGNFTKIPLPSIIKFILKITYLKFNLNLPGAIELMKQIILLTLYAMLFFRKHKIIFTFSIISPYWVSSGSWNTALWKTRNFSSYKVNNNMAADDLVKQGVRALAAMVLAQLSWNILPSAPQGSNSIFHKYEATD